MNFFRVGDSAICVEFGPKIDERLNQKAISYAHCLEQKKWPWMLEVVPAYSSVMIYYNALEINDFEVLRRLKEAARSGIRGADCEAQIHEVPVTYGEQFGPDLESVADLNGISTKKVIEIHTGMKFLVYMLGFMPGFPYCGILPKTIRAPRLPSPRTRVPAGSVGIAESQTGIYPIDSPGGWRLIGRTPLRLFDPSSEQENMFRFKPGDLIHFCPISAEKFHELAN